MWALLHKKFCKINVSSKIISFQELSGSEVKFQFSMSEIKFQEFSRGKVKFQGFSKIPGIQGSCRNPVSY